MTPYYFLFQLKEDFESGLESAIIEYQGRDKHPDSSLDQLQEEVGQGSL